MFKGNYAVASGGKTGVYYRTLTDADTGGTGPVIVIANSDTKIPGSDVTFGSTAPPSAAPAPDPEAPGANQAVSAGFDNEDDPHLGGKPTIVSAELFTRHIHAARLFREHVAGHRESTGA